MATDATPSAGRRGRTDRPERSGRDVAGASGAVLSPAEASGRIPTRPDPGGGCGGHDGAGKVG